MIKFEKYEGNLEGKRRLYSLIPWLEDDTSFKLYKEEIEIINIFKYRELNNQSLKISVDENQYIKVSDIKVPNEKHHIFYTGMEDSNTPFHNGELSVYTDRPNELWIDFNDYEIDFSKFNSVFRAYYINVINDNDMSLDKYLIYITLTHKNNGTIANSDFKIDVSISYRKVNHINVTYGVVDLAFLGYVIWIIVNILFSNDDNVFLKELISDNFGYVICLSYFSQIWFRCKYIGNCYINSIYYNIKKIWYKNKTIYRNFLTNSDVIKRLHSYYKRSLKSDSK